MKKNTVRATVIILVVVVGIVGGYAFLSGRSRDSAKDAILSNVQLVLTRDLQNDYPETVKEVIKYYTEIQKCFYNEEYTEEELMALALQARGLYDAELLAANEMDEYYERLKIEIADYKNKKRRITGASVAASTSVFYFKEDGYDFARIRCGYTLSEKAGNSNLGMTYLLRRDENKRWKIYGWEPDSK